MKARYIILLCVVSIFLNAISIYNLLLGYLSIFIGLLVLIPNFFVKMTALANRGNESEPGIIKTTILNFGVGSYMRTSRRFPLIFGIVLIYIAAIIFIFLQIKFRSLIEKFLADRTVFNNFDQLLPILSISGYVTFFLTLILSTINVVGLLKNDIVFKKK